MWSIQTRIEALSPWKVNAETGTRYSFKYSSKKLPAISKQINVSTITEIKMNTYQFCTLSINFHYEQRGQKSCLPFEIICSHHDKQDEWHFPGICGVIYPIPHFCAELHAGRAFFRSASPLSFSSWTTILSTLMGGLITLNLSILLLALHSSSRSVNNIHSTST